MDLTEAMLDTPTAALLVLFFLAALTARFTLEYRRNNLAAAFAFLLFGGGIYVYGWLGFAVFIAGTLVSAWQRVQAISGANEHIAQRFATRAKNAGTQRTSISAPG